MSKRLVAMLAGAAALAMLVGGCGGSDDEEALTKAQFIKQGDVLCVKANKQFGQDYRAFVKTLPADKGQRSVKAEGIMVGEEVFIPNAQSRAEALAELPAPSGEEDEIDAIVEAIEAGADKAEADPASLYDQKNYPFAEANRLQQEYGFKFCGAGIAE